MKRCLTLEKQRPLKPWLTIFYVLELNSLIYSKLNCCGVHRLFIQCWQTSTYKVNRISRCSSKSCPDCCHYKLKHYKMRISSQLSCCCRDQAFPQPSPPDSRTSFSTSSQTLLNLLNGSVPATSVLFRAVGWWTGLSEWVVPCTVVFAGRVLILLHNPCYDGDTATGWLKPHNDLPFTQTLVK